MTKDKIKTLVNELLCYEEVPRKVIDDLGEKIADAVDRDLYVSFGAVRDAFMEQGSERYGVVCVSFLGIPFHLELIQVDKKRSGVLYATDRDQESKLRTLHNTLSDGWFQTVEIEGSDYVAIMTPHDE
jgi:hypothetical protein